MENPVRRLADRSDDHRDWPDVTRNNGIKNRLFFAAPGEEIHLRTGTLEMICDRMRDLTWGAVMEILAQRSVIDRTDSTFYVKRAQGFGRKQKSGHPDDSSEFTLSEVISNHFNEVERSLDITRREGLRSFVAMRLQKKERESHFSYNTPDMRDIMPSIVDAVTDYMLDRISSLKGNWENIFREVCGIIFDKIKEGGGTPNHPMVSSWAGEVLYGVKSHPVCME